MTKRKKNIEAGLQLAINALGTRYRLAKALKLTPPAVLKWERIPSARVLQVEKVSGVDRAMLRPDLYDKE